MRRPCLIAVDDLPTTPEGMRSIAAQMVCPLCGRGTYKVLSTHVVKSHGINTREFCDLIEVNFRTHFVDEALRERMSQRAKDAGLAELRRPGVGSSRTWSKAGRRASVESSRAVGSSFEPEHFRQMAAAANATEVRKRAAETKRANLPEVEHGLIRYGRGCRCSDCVDACRSNLREGYARRTRVGSCANCGAEFEVYRYSTRTVCQQCAKPHNWNPDPPHGTGSRYRRFKCRCDECQAWRRRTSGRQH